MKNHDHIVLGSLLHDIGKIFERAEMLEDYRKDEKQQQDYCPKNREKHYYSHRHVLNTLKFCETFSEWVPAIAPEINQQRAMADQNWINLAALHHNPSTRKVSRLEKLVQAADHFASAEREQGNFYTNEINKFTRLESLLGRIRLGDTESVNECFLPLDKIQLSGEAIFPKCARAANMVQKSNDQGTVWLNKEKLTSSYLKLAESFLEEIKHFQNFQPHTEKSRQAKSIVRSLLVILEQYLAQVPAATNVIHPDISLYDHLRITAAIAEGLYFYHEQNQDDKNYKENSIEKWQLICGDFSGIQKFIYKITSKGAARGLRGRSFYIQLLCDAVSEQIIRTLGLYATARIYSSGGKFYLLIPTSKIEQLELLVEKVNKDLLQQFQGEIFLAVGKVGIVADDFRAGNMGKRWKQVNEDLQKQRLQPFKAQVEADIECFMPQPLHDQGACQVCGRDDEKADIRTQSERKICQQCLDLEKIGRSLADAKYLFWVWGKDRETVKNSGMRNLTKVTFPGAECHLYFLEHTPQFSELTDLADSHLETLNSWDGLVTNNQGYSQGIRYVGKWQKQEKDSADWEFNDFAEQSVGIHRLGILRMDVDNLGEVFIRGLRFGADKDKTMGSLSRVATLSRQLHLFFAGYLHQIMQGFERSQIIYAGGDDVFIIGSWDELPGLADTIRNEFRRYCANNSCFTLSAGITMVGGKYPISSAAKLAGDAEEQAKNLQRGIREKDALTFLDCAVGWESYQDVLQLRDTLKTICEKTHSKAIIERLRQVVMAVAEIKTRQSQGNIQEWIYWDKWRWRLVYNLKRMEKRYPEVKTELNQLLEQLVSTQTPSNKQPIMDWLQLPVRWAEYLMRSSYDD
jgi:CRISPR-associated protein Csm1